MEKARDPGSFTVATEHLTAAKEHITAAREYLKATRRSLAAVWCSLAPRLMGFFHLWLYVALINVSFRRWKLRTQLRWWNPCPLAPPPSPPKPHSQNLPAAPQQNSKNKKRRKIRKTFNIFSIFHKLHYFLLFSDEQIMSDRSEGLRGERLRPQRSMMGREVHPSNNFFTPIGEWVPGLAIIKIEYRRSKMLTLESAKK